MATLKDEGHSLSTSCVSADIAARGPARLGRPGQAARGLLRGMDFRALWVSQTLSSVGDALVQLALPFAVLRMHHSPIAVGLALTTYGGARVLALPLGGVIGDAYSRRTTLLVTETVKFSTYLVLAIAFSVGVDSLGVLLLCTAAYGVAYGLGMPAATAVLPQTVQAEHLHQANAFLSLSKNIAQVLGFVSSGFLIASTSPSSAYLAAAVCFALDAAVLRRMRTPGPVEWDARPSVFRDLVEGWSVVRARRWYWLNLVTHGLWNISYAVFFVVGPVAAAKYLGGPAAWSALSSAVALGGVCGALFAVAFAPDRPLLHGNVAMASSALALAGLGIHAPITLLFALTVAAFAGPAVLNVLWATTVQERVPGALLSRLSSYDWAVSLSTVPVGSALAGWSLATVGMGATVSWALGCALVPGVVALMDPEMRGMRRIARPLQLEEP